MFEFEEKRIKSDLKGRILIKIVKNKSKKHFG